MGKQAKLKAARRKYILHSITYTEVFREIAIEARNDRLRERGKIPKPRKFRHKWQRKRAAKARTLMTRVICQSMASTVAAMEGWWASR